jgi:hypothetical protein
LKTGQTQIYINETGTVKLQGYIGDAMLVWVAVTYYLELKVLKMVTEVG